MINDEKVGKVEHSQGGFVVHKVEEDEEAAHADAGENKEGGDGGGDDAFDEEWKTGRCRCCKLTAGVASANAFTWNAIGRGAVVMSNIFLLTALIRLASEQAGCDLEVDPVTGDVAPCDLRVYGFKPSSFVTNIATVAGLIAALFLPIVGAIVDFTPHRRLLGMGSAALLTATQAIQIGTGPDTWFPMASLQALNSFLYMVQMMVVFAYLPTISVDPKVSKERMMAFATSWTIVQFVGQLSYLFLIVALAKALKIGAVSTAVLSQIINVVIIVPVFVMSWRLFPAVPALHPRPSGASNCSLVSLGFRQIWKTARMIDAQYGGSLRWFFLAVCFAEATATAFTVVSVTYMVDTLEMSSTGVGIVFIVTLAAALPGAWFGHWITARTNPVRSLKINLVFFAISIVAGGLVLTGPGRRIFMFAFGIIWGFILGWYYPCLQIIYSLSVPLGQESELSGFYVYCRSILTWLPPLVFTLLNESGVNMSYALMSLDVFLVIAFALLHFMVPWEEALEIAAKARKLNLYASVETTQ